MPCAWERKSNSTFSLVFGGMLTSACRYTIIALAFYVYPDEAQSGDVGTVLEGFFGSS